MREHQDRCPAGGHPSILVVEDEAPLREELSAGLEECGFSLRTAGSAEDALAQLAISPDIAVVLMDIRMPGLSGIALAEQILGSQVPSRAVEVVLLTGSASLEDATRAVRTGAFDLLMKSVELENIAEVVGRALSRALERRTAALAVEQERLELQALYAAAPVGLGLVDHDLRLGRANAALVEMLGLREGAELRSLWDALPRAREALEAPLLQVLSGGEAPTGGIRLELEQPAGTAAGVLRVLHLHVYQVPDAKASGQVFAAGLACLDATAEAVLLREMDHRVKNAFASFLGLVHATARVSPGEGARRMATDLTQRVAALARAHDLVRPSITGTLRFGAPKGVDLATLARLTLAAHASEPGERIVIRGPEVTIGPKTAPGLTLVLHELATNALKHGALSAEQGRVTLAWRIEDGVLALEWREAGGPPVAGPPTHAGFGSRLLRQADLGALRQGVALDWSDPAGLRARLVVPVAAIAS